MLGYIMGLVQAFEHRHGFRPQMVSLNPRHLRQLLVEYPHVDPEKFFSNLGIRILVLMENELPHPHVVWLPPNRPLREARRAIETFTLRQVA